ncbi:MAG: 2-amino-4-hydroxy-6-hydroxymethyldihydropteridine diphosphokinase [Geobacteraceae bacterium]
MRHVKSEVFIALGVNLGDREIALLRAIAEIGKLQATRVTAISGFYDTEPVGLVVQENFLNAVLRIKTGLSPMGLLNELQRMETVVFRRRRDVPGGPRTMDIDILFYGSQVLDCERLTIPHPRLHERRFVLMPLAEIAPGFVHPVIGQSVLKLLDSLPNEEKVWKL